jgi:Cof subfamily protein (haloacid dehalogenase superfamily)
MNKYLIALDLDGTLLKDNKKICTRTRLFLHKLQNKGHIIVLASGRPTRALIRYYKELGLHSPIVCYNGAHVYDPVDKSFPEIALKFPKETIIDFYLKIKNIAIKNIMCENETDIWLDKEDQYLSAFFWHNNMNMHYGELDKTLKEDPMTLIVQLKEEKNQKDILEAIRNHPELSARFWGKTPYGEICLKGSSKGLGIKNIADFYNINKDHIIVFGDEDNDIELFAEAGISVAMKNADKRIKEKATMISIKDNNHNGIYYTLKYLNKTKKISI